MQFEGAVIQGTHPSTVGLAGRRRNDRTQRKTPRAGCPAIQGGEMPVAIKTTVKGRYSRFAQAGGNKEAC